MNESIFYIALILFFVSLYIGVKDVPWVIYKRFYLKRKIYLAIGKCPKCKYPLSYTSSGRPICTNGDCK